MPNTEVTIIEPAPNYVKATTLDDLQKKDLAVKQVSVPVDVITQIRRLTPRMGVIEAFKVSPIIAKKLLELNKGNRPLSKTLVRKYVQKMTHGHWKYGGNTLKFSKSFRLLDGQHSLNAVVESQTTQIFTIITGLNDDSFSVMDAGKGRSKGDTLAVGGIRNANVTAAAIGAYIYYTTSGSVGAKISHTQVDNLTIASWLDQPAELKKMERSVLKAIALHATKTGTFLAQSSWAFLHYAMARKSLAQANEFLELLASGEMISRSKFSPIYLCRNQLLALQNKTVTPDGRIIWVKMNYVLTAWNHYRAGEEIAKLHINTKITTLPKMM